MCPHVPRVKILACRLKCKAATETADSIYDETSSEFDGHLCVEIRPL